MRTFPGFVLLAVLLPLGGQQSSLESHPLRVVELKANTDHVQGIDTDGAHLWVTSVDRPSAKGHLYRFSAVSGDLEASAEVQIGEQYHPGGLALDGDSIWIPVAEYKPTSSAVIQKRNKDTLKLEFQFPVSDHIGCVAVTPELIIGGNWDSRDFYIWNHQGKLLRKVSSSTGNSYQDLKIHAGALVASGGLTSRQGAVDWLDLDTFQLLYRMPVGSTDQGESLTREGMTLFNGEIWFLPEDARSRLLTYRLPPH